MPLLADHSCPVSFGRSSEHPVIGNMFSGLATLVAEILSCTGRWRCDLVSVSTMHAFAIRRLIEVAGVPQRTSFRQYRAEQSLKVSSGHRSRLSALRSEQGRESIIRAWSRYVNWCPQRPILSRGIQSLISEQLELAKCRFNQTL